MKIYVDNIVMNFQKIGGISVYLTKIISRLMRDKLDLILIEQKRVNNNVLRNELHIPDVNIINENHLPLRLLSYMPISVKLREKALVHSSYYRICNNPLAANIITVYDFNYELGYVRRGIRKYLHCHQKKHSIERADGIICISESTKRDLLNFYPHVHPSKIKVIHLAAGEVFFQIGSEQSVPIGMQYIDEIQRKKFILFVGARIYHKNFGVCVDTIAKLPGYELFIVGGDLTAAEVELLDSKLPSRYHAFNSISASDLNYLYNNAFCLLYPTSYEGFGIPVLEAMQAGCPVVSTKFSSIPEVSGDAGLLVDDISPTDFVNKICSLEDQAFRSKVITAGLEQANKFSWDKTYQETLAFYLEVFNNKFSDGKASL